MNGDYLMYQKIKKNLTKRNGKIQNLKLVKKNENRR